MKNNKFNIPNSHYDDWWKNKKDWQPREISRVFFPLVESDSLFTRLDRTIKRTYCFAYPGPTSTDDEDSYYYVKDNNPAAIKEMIARRLLGCADLFHLKFNQLLAEIDQAKDMSYLTRPQTDWVIGGVSKMYEVFDQLRVDKLLSKDLDYNKGQILEKLFSHYYKEGNKWTEKIDTGAPSSIRR
jgi:hypothetical protein